MPPPQRLIGIVGKTNVGKSTFFAAATLAQVEIANHPFTTIEPNVGVGYVRVRCAHVELGLPKCDPATGYCLEGWRFIPIKLMDVAGLIPGAHEGRGLGNKFLDDLRKADALILVVDAAGATDPEGRPAKPGSYDPIEEVRWLERELDEWYYRIVSRDWERFTKTLYDRNPVEALAQRLSGIGVTKQHVERVLRETGLEARHPREWSTDELREFASQLRRVSKPMLIAANKADLDPASENIERMRKELPYPVVPTSAAAELALKRATRAGFIRYIPGDPSFEIIDESRLTREQRRALEYIEERVLKRYGSTGVQEALNKTVFELLDMIVVYPVEDANRYADSRGRILPDAYLVPRGTTARQLAYMIHTDLGKTFLYAIDAKSKRRIGEDHILEDGAVVKIVAAAAKH